LAVASSRSKYDDVFRVPTLLGAQPLDHRTITTWQYNLRKEES
jgi:hypothetical protein